MAKVYAVLHCSWEGDGLHGIFSSRELAEKYIKKRTAFREGALDVQEWIVDREYLPGQDIQNNERY